MKNRSTISVGIWTYADAKYAEETREHITKQCNLPKDFFLFTYSFDDISGPYSKDIRHVYRHFPEFNKSNTFLVDNLASNVMHHINKNNGIVIPSFAPYGFNSYLDPSLNGKDEIRNMASFLDHTKARHDRSLRDIIQICKKVVKYVEPENHVFSKRRVLEMRLESFFAEQMKQERKRTRAKNDLKKVKRKTRRVNYFNHFSLKFYRFVRTLTLTLTLTEVK